MTPERWARVREVFEAAVESPKPERDPLLDRECAGDADLRHEVVSLLQAHDEAGSFLETDALGLPALEPSEPPPALRGGDRLGPYEIMAALGSGGMGEVYRARDGRLGREVAVKVLRPRETPDAARLKRFEQEARMASALNHPNIVAVYDVGWHDGAPFIVTELLEGQTLGERSTPVPARKALELALQVATGLAEAHELGVVHRDIKPSNLFVTNGGQLKILDFGVAKLAPQTEAGGGEPVTEPGLIIGTAGYMSPEQARGGAVDFRSDQFSLGCLLYELLTGRPPFRRASAVQTLAALLEDEPPPLGEANPRVPPHVAWLVERCLAKEPGERYFSTRDLVRDLQLALARLSTPSREDEPRSRSRRLLGWLGVPVALAVLGTWVVARTWHARPSSAGAPVVRFMTHSGTDSAPAAAPDGNTIAFTSRRDGHRRIWLRQIASGSEAPLTSGEDDCARFSPDGATVLFARSEGGRVSLYRVPTVGGDARKVADDALYGDFSPDGSRIAFFRQVGEGAGVTATVVVALADGSSPRELTRLDGRAYPGGAFVRPRWSPDGRTLAATQSTRELGEPTVVGLIDVETGALRHVAPPSDAGVWRGALVWTGPDEVVFAQPDSVVGQQTGTSSQVILWNLASGQTQALFSSPVNVVGLDELGTGRLVLEARTVRQNLREVPLEPSSGSSEHWLTRGNAADRQPVYGRDGDWIAFSSNRNGNLDIFAVSRRSGAVRRLTDHVGHDSDPSFMPDGRLLFSSNRTGAFEIWVAAADGSGAHQITRDGSDAENPVATPDGQWIVYAAMRPRAAGIMRVRPDGSEPSLIVSGNLIEPEVSPDGRHLAFVADNGSHGEILRVARLADGATELEIPLPRAPTGIGIDQGRCRWLPDGHGLAFILREGDSYGVYLEELGSGGGRRLLVGLGPDLQAESLAISPDGKSLTVSFREELHDLMLAEGIDALGRVRR